MQQKKPQYIRGEAFTEANQEIGTKAPSLDEYDPYEFNDDVAQMQQQHTQMRPPQFLDLSDPSKIARTENQQVPPQGYPQQGYPHQGQYPHNRQMPIQEVVEPAPDLFNANTRLDELTSIMDKVNAVSQGVDAEGRSTQQFAIGVALKALRDSVKMLEEIDYWIPQGKEKYTPQLKKIAAPIVKALTAYIGTIDKLK